MIGGAVLSRSSKQTQVLNGAIRFGSLLHPWLLVLECVVLWDWYCCAVLDAHLLHTIVLAPRRLQLRHETLRQRLCRPEAQRQAQEGRTLQEHKNGCRHIKSSIHEDNPLTVSVQAIAVHTRLRMSGLESDRTGRPRLWFSRKSTV